MSVPGSRNRVARRAIRACNPLSFDRLEGRLLLSAFSVNSNDDVNDTVCDSNHCSLREALEAANATTGADEIAFNIPTGDVPTIQPTSPLPVITGPVTIDGTTQPAGKVELDG